MSSFRRIYTNHHELIRCIALRVNSWIKRCSMKLTTEEQQMLDGEHGRATQKAMEILVALGTIYGAERMVPVTSVQIAGVSYDNLGEAGLHWLSEMADGGGKTRVLTTLNPGGHGHRELAGVGHQRRICAQSAARHRRLRAHERGHHLLVHAVPHRQLAALRAAHRVGRKQRRVLRQLRHRRAEQSRRRTQRPRRGLDGRHARIRLAPRRESSPRRDHRSAGRPARQQRLRRAGRGHRQAAGTLQSRSRLRTSSASIRPASKISNRSARASRRMAARRCFTCAASRRKPIAMRRPTRRSRSRRPISMKRSASLTSANQKKPTSSASAVRISPSTRLRALPNC